VLLAAGLLEEMPFANISSRLNPAVFPDAKDLTSNTSIGNLVTLEGEARGGPVRKGFAFSLLLPARSLWQPTPVAGPSLHLWLAPAWD
jgi:hypothetical protein